jgi:glutaredoxin/glutathione-dependent peroxiredoxin
MSIKVGDTLPDATLISITPAGPAPLATHDLFSGKKVVLFGVPGAYTGVCTKQHMPGFVQDAEAIKAKGVDTIACLAVNDPAVLTAWSKDTGADGKILMLSDWNAEYIKQLGLDFDGSKFGLGTRSKRFSAVVDNCVVKELNVEDSPGQVTTSSAANALCQL